MSKKEQDAVTDYWLEYYADPHCTLCGNSGMVDTRGVRTANGVEAGRLNFCICPCGQARRNAELGPFVQMTPHREIVFRGLNDTDEDVARKQVALDTYDPEFYQRKYQEHKELHQSLRDMHTRTMAVQTGVSISCRGFDPAISREMIGDLHARDAEKKARDDADRDVYEPPAYTEVISYWGRVHEAFARSVYTNQYRKRTERNARKTATAALGVNK
jgi:hypothetical protein